MTDTYRLTVVYEDGDNSRADFDTEAEAKVAFDAAVSNLNNDYARIDRVPADGRDAVMLQQHHTEKAPL
ncbi:MAG: hypothetical protein JWM76_1427 [Pseudonocardiales bacterium]|nr:hypothetical protein [Pseudonocardiales bacterium]